MLNNQVAGGPSVSLSILAAVSKSSLKSLGRSYMKEQLPLPSPVPIPSQLHLSESFFLEPTKLDAGAYLFRGADGGGNGGLYDAFVD